MVITQADIIGKIRKTIDDIVPNGVTDSFVTDVNKELWQATLHATIELSAELPYDLLDATVENLSGTYDEPRGFSYAQTDDNFLRFVSLDITGCAGILWELIEAGSDEEKMQRSPWSRGTATKPKAMMDQDENGKKVIVWWPGAAPHNKAQLAYIKTSELVEVARQDIPVVPAIICAIRPEAEKEIIYRAASIFFEGKKEGEIADRFKNL